MLSRSFIDQILLGPLMGMRFTQDSAVLPEVWAAFAANPNRRQPLLLTPYRNGTAGRLARKVIQRLDHGKAEGPRRRRRDAAYIDAVVAIDLTLAELLSAILPITSWWQDHTQRLTRRFGDTWLNEHTIAHAVGRVLHDPDSLDAVNVLPDDIARILSLIGLMTAHTALGPTAPDIEERLNSASGKRQVIKAVTHAIVTAPWFRDLRPENRAVPDESMMSATPGSELVFLVSLNRPVFPAMQRSIPAIKADAAVTLFNVNCSALTWAIIDSGIDAKHRAFATADGKSRVREIFDFTRVRSILSIDRIDRIDAKEDLMQLHQELSIESNLSIEDVRRRLEQIHRDIELGRSVDWNLVRPLLKRADDTPPYTDHGTHVAGILAARGYDELPSGVCRDIHLLDLRVLSSTIEETEFAVIAALQFIRFLNASSHFMAVHGVNLSISIPHDVRNYACGRTPVCEEASRLTSSGVVVVAAAGNQGWQPATDSDSGFARYNDITITDPGNAEDVITVGSTHRFRPHTYGVSYFSSRGPTGDGRSKPDLVAPGEKIYSALPEQEWGAKDGTSMAAPHVSGAAALLMGRHTELIGNPARIKQVLCATATDLGRERHFQGAGMLDALRALQSI